MSHKRHHKKIIRHGAYHTKQEADAEAKRLKNQGHQVRVRKDPFTGKFIVEIIVLALAIGLLGTALRIR